MKSKKNTLFFLFVLFGLIVVLSGCTKTTTRVNDPVFTDQAKVERELVSLVRAENINLNGREITTNDVISTELEISIMNGEDIPKSIDVQNVLQKAIARAIRSNLRDPNQFESYNVLLVKKTENNGLTKRNWTGKTFKASEL